MFIVLLWFSSAVIVNLKRNNKNGSPIHRLNIIVQLRNIQCKTIGNQAIMFFTRLDTKS